MLNSYLAQEKIRDLHKSAASKSLSGKARRQSQPDPEPRRTWGARLRNRFAFA